MSQTKRIAKKSAKPVKPEPEVDVDEVEVDETEAEATEEAEDDHTYDEFSRTLTNSLNKFNNKDVCFRAMADVLAAHPQAHNFVSSALEVQNEIRRKTAHEAACQALGIPRPAN